MSCSGNATYMSTTGTAAEYFTAALQFFAAQQCYVEESPHPESSVSDGETFDMIIVGAGTAGCAIASRLCEIPEVNVLLIEAGGDCPLESMIPRHGRSLYGNDTYDWSYLTADNGVSSQANINGSVSWPRGKMLGGCSSINEMIYIKGNPHDYLEWYNAGNTEWHPDVVDTYFKKAESLQNAELLNNTAIRETYGLNGSHPVQRFNSTYRFLTNNVLKSCDEIGIPWVEDLNAAKCLGAGVNTVAAADGRRKNAATVHLTPEVMSRSNFKLLKNTLVRKVLINSTSLTAYGVEVERNGQVLSYLASKEVIVCAGAVNSPQLLMLSGVGPKQLLEDNNITCLYDSNMVGKNLQDHLIVPVTIYGNEQAELDVPTEHFEAIEYMFNRKGYLAQASIADIIGFYSSNESATYPDYQFHFQVFHPNSSTTRELFELVRYNESVVDSIVEQNKYKSLYLFYINLLHPKSLGNITIQSNNPNDKPIIHANYFNNPDDLINTAKAIKMLTKIVNTTYFKNIDAYIGRLNIPQCNELELDTEEYWSCISLNTVITVYHPVGTCMMGPDPETSVVDGRTRVHGVQGMRVSDASAMPSEISGNTNAPVNMFGERVADLIKEDLLNSRK